MIDDPTHDGFAPLPSERPALPLPGAGEAPGAALTLWQGGQAAGTLALTREGTALFTTVLLTPANLALTFTPAPLPVPVFTASPALLDFGSVTVGQSKSLAVVITNTGDAPLTVDSEPMIGTDWASFFRAAGTNVDKVSIAPGGTFTYTYLFTPTTAGTKTASAQLVTSLGLKLIPLFGTATAYVPPLPPVPTTKNVRDYGAKGDGVTDDSVAVNRAVNAANSGQTVYFPAGTYRLAGAIGLQKSGLAFLGDGAASVLKYESVAFQIGPSGHPVGTRIARLQFLGRPGLYQQDGNGATAIMGEMATINSLPAGAALTVEDCDFRGCGWGYRSGGGSTVLGDGSRWAVNVRNCRFNGWGVCPFFLLSGETVEGCTLTQDDPAFRSSHGFYIHAGSRDVHVRDCRITNARKWGIQVWCQYPNTVIDGVTLERVSMTGCAGGLIIARSEVVGMAVRNVTATGCAFTRTGAEAIHVSTGVNLTLTGNAVDTASVGLLLDGPKGEIANMLFQGNQIRNCPNGILVQPNVPPAGTFSGVRLLGNTITNCPTPINLAGQSGIVVG